VSGDTFSTPLPTEPPFRRVNCVRRYRISVLRALSPPSRIRYDNYYYYYRRRCWYAPRRRQSVRSVKPIDGYCRRPYERVPQPNVDIYIIVVNRFGKCRYEGRLPFVHGTRCSTIVRYVFNTRDVRWRMSAEFGNRQ